MRYASKNSVEGKEVPFWDYVQGRNHWVGFNGVVAMAQELTGKAYYNGQQAKVKEHSNGILEEEVRHKGYVIGFGRHT